jgi:hypothetical protein
MKSLGRENSKTLAMHGKKWRVCRGKGIKPGRGNEKTSMFLLQKALSGLARVIGGLDFSGSP